MAARWLGLILLTAFALSSMAQPNCDLRAICYALDQSGSISDKHYAVLQRFTVGSARAFDALARKSIKTEYSAVAFSFESLTIAPPTFELEKNFVPAIRKPRKFRSSTNIYSGLRDCFEILQAAPPGARALVLVTDGAHNRGGENPIKQIQDANIAVVSVGVGTRVNATALKMYATEPHFFIPATFKNLPYLGASVVNAACKAAEVLASPEPILPNTTVVTQIFEPSPLVLETPLGFVSSPEPVDGNLPSPTIESDHIDDYLLISPDASTEGVDEQTPEPSILFSSSEPENSLAVIESPSIIADILLSDPNNNVVPVQTEFYVFPSSTPSPPDSNSKATVTPSITFTPLPSSTIEPVSQSVLSSISPIARTPEFTPMNELDEVITPSTRASLEPMETSEIEASSYPTISNSNDNSLAPSRSLSPLTPLKLNGEIVETPSAIEVPSIEVSPQLYNAQLTPDNDKPEPVELPTETSIPDSSLDNLSTETLELSPESVELSPLPWISATERPTAGISPSSTSEPSYLDVSPSNTPVPMTPSASPSASPMKSKPRFTTTYVPSSIVIPTTTITTTLVPVIVVKPEDAVEPKPDDTIAATIVEDTGPKLEVRGISSSVAPTSRTSASSSAIPSTSPTSTPSVEASVSATTTITSHTLSQSRIDRNDGCERAFSECMFTFDNLPMITSYQIGSFSPDNSFTGTITFKPGSSHVVGAVNSGMMTAEFVYSNSMAMEIINYGNPKFVPTSLKTVPVSESRSGIAHEVLQGSQIWDLRYRCVRMWFEDYQLLDKDGSTIGNVHSTSMRDSACVVFRTI